MFRFKFELRCRFRTVPSRPSPTRVVPPSRCASTCPFQVLGFERRRRTRSSSVAGAVAADQSIPYERVRAAFRELALQHHPDTSETTPGRASAEFSRIREAFEAIAESPDGTAVLREERPFAGRRQGDEGREPGGERGVYKNEEDVDPHILREVAEVAREMNPGGLDKGGMWQYANMIRVEAERGRLPPLRVDVGVEATNEDGVGGKRLARRRKRK